MLGILCLLVLWDYCYVLYTTETPTFQACLRWSELAAPIDHNQIEYGGIFTTGLKGPVQGMFSWSQ